MCGEGPHTKLSEEALQDLAKQAVDIIATEKEELNTIEAHCTQDLASIGECVSCFGHSLEVMVFGTMVSNMAVFNFMSLQTINSTLPLPSPPPLFSRLQGWRVPFVATKSFRSQVHSNCLKGLPRPLMQHSNIRYGPCLHS